MIKHILLILIVILSFRGFSQVSLTLKDVPQIGTKICYNNIYNDTSILNNFSFSKSGIDNFWDFSNLNIKQLDTNSFTNPQFTEFKDYFSNSTLAVNDLGNLSTLIYYKQDSMAFYETGIATFYPPCPGIQSYVYSGPMQVIKFSANYGDVHFDTVILNSKIYPNLSGDTSFFKRYIYVKSEIVATGKIKLPFGLFESFLKKTSGLFVDTTWKKVEDGSWKYEIEIQPRGSVNFTWYCNKSTFFVARVNNWYEGINGKDMQDNIHYQMNNYANLKSLTVEDISSLKTKIYPNPATEKLYIENNLAQNCNYLITNLLGQEVDRGLLKSEIDISHLLNGVFVLKIVSTNNQTQVFKFIKQ